MWCALASNPRRRGSPSARGFTLTELMVVVTMVGVLSVLGVAAFRKQISSSKTSEALSVVQALRAAQETYRSENQVYLDVTSNGANWYPTDQFGELRHSWRINPSSHDDGAAWAALNANVTQPVQFRYLVDAGGPGVALPTLALPNPPTLGTPSDSWYVIQARADFDSDETYCDVLAWSHSTEVFVRNDGE